MRKYGFDSFKVEVLCRCPDNDALDKAEKFFIWLLATQKKSFGYNLTSGGESPSPSDEAREKFRAALIGRKRPPFSQEWRDNLSASHKGKPSSRKGKRFGPLSEAHREKVRLTSTGRTHTEETRRKMSGIAKKRGNNNRIGYSHTQESIEKMRSNWTPERREIQSKLTRLQREANAVLCKAIDIAMALGGCETRAQAKRAIFAAYIQKNKLAYQKIKGVA